MPGKLRIIFYGTPAFAVESLRILIDNNYHIAAVVTAPDKPSGRGLQVKQPAIKEFALQHDLKVFQPLHLNDEYFLNRVKQLDAHLQVVVAFRIMPEALWSMPPLGTFNLHASLLPQYRGAAPINRAIMNGETETGVTTFFLKHEVDTGNIIMREQVKIGAAETAGELHDRLKILGAKLVLKTICAIEKGTLSEIPQSKLLAPEEELKTAPKIFKKDCEINWKKSTIEIYNHIRGLSPHPAAYFKMRNPSGREEIVKVFRADKIIDLSRVFTNEILSDDKTYFNIQCNGGYITIEELQITGKKKMGIKEFLRGHKVDDCQVVPA